jgi:hypothetical protein
MSINAVSGVVQAHRENDLPPAISPLPPVAPFNQQLDDAQANLNLAAKRHPHRDGQAQSANASPPAAGAATSSSLAATIINLLS